MVCLIIGAALNTFSGGGSAKANMLIILLSALVFLCAILHLRAEYYGPRRLTYFFKPLTMLVIILIALLTNNPVPSFYKYAVVAGLICSLAGDIFLMLPAERFIAGLVSFLIAHIFYIAAFTFEGAHAPGLITAIPFLVYGALMLRVLLPHLGGLKAPVMIYVLVIMLMAWQALNRWIGAAGEPEASALLALAGALLFVVSDSALALNRFRGRFRGAQACIMSTYFIGQWLIALST